MISTNEFKVGDTAVYPAHGVAVIKRIDERKVGNSTKRFYVLQVVSTSMTIMVPTENAQSIGLRGVVTDSEVTNVYQILKSKNVKIDQTTWNRRFREYSEKIKTGSLYEIAEVLRNLFLLRGLKDLSFGERKMLEQAKELLVREISISKKVQENIVDSEITTLLGPAGNC